MKVDNKTTKLYESRRLDHENVHEVDSKTTKL